MDQRITQYDSYPQATTLQRAYLQGMIEQTPQLQQLLQVLQVLQVFAGSLPATLPNNELGDRARKMYGSDFALEMYRLNCATDALKARYVSDLNAALSSQPGQNDPSQPWWHVTPAVTTQTIQFVNGGSSQMVTTTTGGSAQFDMASYQQWYGLQADPVHQLFAQIYGSGAASIADPTGNSQGPQEVNDDYRTIKAGPTSS